jgi:hypothetical protein
MRTPIDPTPLRAFLHKETIATLEQLKHALGTSSTMTVFRKLKTLGYRSSYSHRGKFYTLKDIPHFDDLGLWSFHWVWFSKYGNLIETARQFVEKSQAGYTVQELEELLHVECKAALLKLHQQSQLERESNEGLYVYFSAEAAKQGSQRLERQTLGPELSGAAAALAHELKAAIVLFHSLLDEKQRRLHAGLEAFKLGHGGDQQIAELLGIDRHTVAKGRRELLGGEVSGGRIREPGAGRKPQEKKRQKS